MGSSRVLLISTYLVVVVVVGCDVGSQRAEPAEQQQQSQEYGTYLGGLPAYTVVAGSRLSKAYEARRPGTVVVGSRYWVGDR